jgi:hypothetical protein
VAGLLERGEERARAERLEVSFQVADAFTALPDPEQAWRHNESYSVPGEFVIVGAVAPSRLHAGR